MAKSKWTQPKDNPITLKIACRLYLTKQDPPANLTATDIMEIAFGKGQGISRLKNPLSWWKNLTPYLIDYDINWIDWTEEDKLFVKQRLLDQIPRDHLKLALNIPDVIMQECIKDAILIKTNPKPIAEETKSVIKTKPQSATNDEYDTYVNSEMEEYSKRINMDNPVNRDTVKSMIALQWRMAKLNEQLVDPTLTIAELDGLTKVYESMRKMYSSAAEDVAQLQRQLAINKEGETLADVVEIMVGKLPEWRDIVMDMRMEELHLIDLMVELHKVDMGYEHTGEQLTPKREGDINPTTKSKPFMGEGEQSFVVQS